MKILILLMLCFVYSSASAEVTNIDVRQLKDIMNEDPVIIDVRTPGEWRQTGIVEGSIPIMFFDERRKPLAEEWLAEASQYISPDKQVILICRTGSRTGMIANYLVKQHGYENVLNVQGGIVAWQRAGYQTVSP